LSRRTESEGYDFHLEIDAYPARDGGVAVFWREISARVRLLTQNDAARVEAEARAATLAAVLDPQRLCGLDVRARRVS